MNKLTFYYSAMNAGKSTSLLQTAHNYTELGFFPIIFNYYDDNRLKKGVISTRIGIEKECLLFDNNTVFNESLIGPQYSTSIYAHYNWEKAAIFIDEAQFLTQNQVLDLTAIVDRWEIPIRCYGLRTDFQGNPFEGSTYLMAWADEIKEIECIGPDGNYASMNARYDDKGQRVVVGPQIQIGYNYKSLSRKEFDLVMVRNSSL